MARFRRLGRLALAAALACSLCPVPALADDGDAGGSGAGGAALQPGTYVEHEAVALVANAGGADAGAGIRALSGSALDSAEPIVGVSAEAVAETIGEEEAAEALASAGNAAAAARTLAEDGGEEGDAATVVVVRDESKSTAELIAELEADSRVIVAEPNWLVSADDGDEADATADAAAQAGTADAADAGQAAASDVDLTRFQWEYGNDGTFGGAGSEGIDIGYDGWNASQGQADDSVVVAVLDTGVDAANPDLAPVMWTDDGSHPGLAALGGDAHGLSLDTDDDGNHVSSYENITEAHGTHVAGIVAAAWNGEGVSGAAQNAQIMSLRYGGPISSIFTCFNYIKTAVQEGVNVRASNNSWTLGAGESQIVNTVVYEVGRLGVACVFGSANSTTDMDGQSMTAGTLASNPYALSVGSVDPTGIMSVFSNYGTITTDVMAPGATILSTAPVSQMQYLAEADADAVLYQSFEDASAQQGAFASAGTVVRDQKAFEGDAALALAYDPAAEGVDGDGYQWASSGVMDLSAAAGDNLCMSFRFTAAEMPEGNNGGVEAKARVKLTDGTWADVEAKGAFRAFSDAWGGFYLSLPENTDFEHFEVQLGYRNVIIHSIGGPRTMEPVAGTVLIDSIGVGGEDAKVPYMYMQGTSMAGPAACGVLAEVAYRYQDESADKLVARVVGSSTGRGGIDWSDYCKTGGMPDVDQAASPAPAVSSAKDNGDGTLTVSGWFFGEGAQVSLAGEAAAIVEDKAGTTELGRADADARVLVVEKPAGYTGGVTEVDVTAASGKSGRLFALLGNSTEADLYDETDLPLPTDIADWGRWRLVGYAGDVYLMPQDDTIGAVYEAHAYHYLPASQTWEAFDIPEEVAAETGIDRVAGISAATADGVLVMRVRAESSDEAYLGYTADGSWAVLAKAGSLAADTKKATLASDGEDLYTFGGTDAKTGTETSAICRVDFAAGTVSQIGSMVEARYEPQVTYRDGVFLVSAGLSRTWQGVVRQGVERVAVASDGSLSASTVDTSYVVEETGQLAWGVAAVADGFMLAGPESIDGAADTYTLDSAEGATPAAYAKRASSLPLQLTSALAYDGTLYVFSATAGTPQRIFSATAVQTAAQPGDYAAPEPEPEPTPTPEPAPEPGQGGDGSGGATQADAPASGKALAKTGDATAPAALALGSLAALAAAGGALARSRMRR